MKTNFGRFSLFGVLIWTALGTGAAIARHEWGDVAFGALILCAIGWPLGGVLYQEGK